MIRVSSRNKTERAKIRRLVVKHRLNRRKVYEVGYSGELAMRQRFTAACFTCSCDCGYGGCSHRSSGCRECGYTGKRRSYFPEPGLINGQLIQLTADPFAGGE